jgi:hypothetical protein
MRSLCVRARGSLVTAVTGQLHRHLILMHVLFYARTCDVFPVAPCEGSVLVDLIDVVQDLAAGRRGVEAERRPQIVTVQAPLAQHRRVQTRGREQGGQPVGHVHHLVGHPARVVHP